MAKKSDQAAKSEKPSQAEQQPGADLYKFSAG